ncbi:hypothetical protein NXE71_003248 [Escherichia coli]|nr:hypothetical protein [Escherichia coli]HAY0471535.1 hypothetical protein [Escherichia coli]
MKGIIIKAISLSMLLVSSLVYACGDNPNAIVQGPFKDSVFNNGVICFQNSPDKKDIYFYQTYLSAGGNINKIIDIFILMLPLRIPPYFLPQLLAREM